MKKNPLRLSQFHKLLSDPLKNFTTEDLYTDLIDCVTSLGYRPQVRHQTDIIALLENKQDCLSLNQEEATRMTELLFLF